MQKSKLIRTLSLLSEEEMRCLQSFLQSPYFNTNTKVVKLYGVLRAHHPNFSSPKLAKEKVFKKIFPYRPYAHQQMLNLMSEFYRLLEKYLIQLQLEKKEMRPDELLLEAYEERPNCFSIFEKRINALNKKLDELPFRDEIYFNKKKELFLKYYSHPDTYIQVGDKGTLSKAFECFDAEKKLVNIKLQCALNARTNTIKDKKDIKTKLENPLLSLYEKLEKFQRSEAFNDFNKLIYLFELNINLLRTEDKTTILKMLTNYCTRQTNNGQSHFFPIMLDLYKLGLENGCLVVNGKISKNVFQNISTVAATCQEFDWSKKFMGEYKNLLDESIKADAIATGMGLWYFEKKEYNDAIDAMQHSFTEPFDIIRSKSVLIRSWFELWKKDDHYYDFLIIQLETFEKYIRRNKSLTSNKKETIFKFIFYTKRMAGINWNKEEIKILKKEIEQEPFLVFKKWLLEKLMGKK